MKEVLYWSRLKNFYSQALRERQEILTKLDLDLEPQDFINLERSLDLEKLDSLSENVVGKFSLPFSVVPNFIINESPVLIPMVTEEPSVVAAASNIAKLVGFSGGFRAHADKAIMTGQIQFFDIHDIDKNLQIFKNNFNIFVEFLHNELVSMAKRGGGFKNLRARPVQSDLIGPMLIIEIDIDVVDAMGANIVNTLLEHFAEKFKNIFNAQVGARILTNLCDRRLAYAECNISVDRLGSDRMKKLLAVHAFAEADIYRACTHNKGILNGVEAVALATGNDTRAISSAVHCFASKSGVYGPLTQIIFDSDKKEILAKISLPLAVGVVGGITKAHTGVNLAHKILGRFSKTAQSLAVVMASVGLAQCLAALLALSGEGIQKGHMRLHRRKNTRNIKI